MVGLVEVRLDNGGLVLVEMDHVSGGVVKAGRADRVVAQAKQTLEEALDSVTPVAQSILTKLRKAGPQAATVEFGVNFTVEAGAVIAKTSGSCHVKVILHWKPDWKPGDDAGS